MLSKLFKVNINFYFIKKFVIYITYSLLNIYTKCNNNDIFMLFEKLLLFFQIIINF
jgi:hypothetical protein